MSPACSFNGHSRRVAVAVADVVAVGFVVADVVQHRVISKANRLFYSAMKNVDWSSSRMSF